MNSSGYVVQIEPQKSKTWYYLALVIHRHRANVL